MLILGLYACSRIGPVHAVFRHTCVDCTGASSSTFGLLHYQSQLIRIDIPYRRYGLWLRNQVEKGVMCCPWDNGMTGNPATEHLDQ